LERRFLIEQVSKRIPTEEGQRLFFEWLRNKYPKLQKFLRDNYSGDDDYDKYFLHIWNYKVRIGETEKSLGDLFYESGGGYSWSGAINPPKANQYWEDALNKAKDWWFKWLSNPLTMSKFQKINNKTTSQTKRIFDEYYKIISNVTFKHYYKKDILPTDPFKDIKINAIAHVSRGKNNLIFLNLDQKENFDSNELTQSFIHEIQHLLYFYYPLNPDNKTSKFIPSDGCYEKNKKIYDNTELDYWEKIDAIVINKKDSIAKDLGVEPNLVSTFISRIVHIAYNEGWVKEYIIQNNSEFLSRLNEVRKYFNIPYGGDITKKNIVDFIKNLDDNASVDYILAQWIVKDFPPLDQWLKELNSFVRTDGNKQKPSPTDLPYKPKTGIA
jgi:hypothetical protein